MNKPCWRRRKDLALLAASALSEAETAELRVHLRQCPGCQAHVDALHLIVSEHSEGARDLPFIEPSPGFYRRMEERIQGSGEELGRFEPERRIVWPRIGWLGAGLAAAICVLLVEWPGRQPVPEGLDLREPEQTVLRAADSTQIAFRQALNRSFDEFDELLARGEEGHRTGQESEQLNLLMESLE